MDTDRLNRWLTLVANIGVLIGILLLVYELNQNSELMRAQISSDRSSHAIELNMIAAESIELSEVFATLGGSRYSGDFSKLSPVQLEQYKSFLIAERFRHENLLQQQVYGLFHDFGQLEAARNLAPTLEALGVMGGPEYMELIRQVEKLHGS